MTLETYFKKLTDFVNEHPDLMQRELVYAKDDEGNGYDPVVFDPGTLLKKIERPDDKGFNPLSVYTTDFQLEEETDVICIN